MTPRERARERQEHWFGQGLASVRAATQMPMVITGFATGQDQLTGAPQEIASHENEYKHMRKGWPFAAIRPIANRFAEQSLMAGRMLSAASAKRGAPGWRKELWPKWVKQIRREIELLESHDILEILRNPNPIHVEWQLEWITAGSLQATGKAFWWFTVVDGRVRVWPLPAHWCTPIATKAGDITGWLVDSGGAGESTVIPDDQIAYFSFPDPANPFASLAPLAAAARTIINDDAIHLAQNQQFKGGHLPDHAFILGEITQPDGTKERPEMTTLQREELETRLSQLYGGPRNHGKSIVLDRLIADVKRLSVAPTEMDYMNSMKITKNEIMQMFGVNPIIAGEIENANRASATIADENFVGNVINPMLELVGQVLTKFIHESSLFRDTSSDIILFYDKLEPQDPVLFSDNMKWSYEHGIVDDDAIRAHLLKMPPKKNGGGTARISPLLVDVVVDGVREDVPPVPPKSRRSMQPRQVFRATWLKQHSSQEDRVRSAVASLLNQQTSEIVEALRRGAAPDARLLIAGTMETQSLIQAVRPGLMQAALIGAGIEESATKFHVGRIKQLDRRQVEQRIATYLAELFRQSMWGEFQDTTRDILQGALTDGVRRGLDARALADLVQEQLREMARVRALRLARTETTNLLNAGADAVRLELADEGIVATKEWSTTKDKETRGADPKDTTDHLVMDGQVVPASAMFVFSNGEQAPFPGHYSLSGANRIHCRCIGISGVFDQPGDDEPVIDVLGIDVNLRPRGGCLVHSNGKLH